MSKLIGQVRLRHMWKLIYGSSNYMLWGDARRSFVRHPEMHASRATSKKKRRKEATQESRGHLLTHILSDGVPRGATFSRLRRFSCCSDSNFDKLVYVCALSERSLFRGLYSPSDLFTSFIGDFGVEFRFPGPPSALRNRTRT